MPENACTSNTVTEDMNKVEEVLETERMEVDNPEPDEMVSIMMLVFMFYMLCQEKQQLEANFTDKTNITTGTEGSTFALVTLSFSP